MESLFLRKISFCLPVLFCGVLSKKKIKEVDKNVFLIDTIITRLHHICIKRSF